jgi:hypothetical protein
VQETGQLAGAEAVLDLLLEPADEEHLAEETAQDFFETPRPPDSARSSTVVIERPLC